MDRTRKLSDYIKAIGKHYGKWHEDYTEEETDKVIKSVIGSTFTFMDGVVIYEDRVSETSMGGTDHWSNYWIRDNAGFEFDTEERALGPGN